MHYLKQHISVKLISVIMLLIILSMTVVLVVFLTCMKGKTDDLMESRASSSMLVLENEMKNEMTRLDNIADYLVSTQIATGAFGNGNPAYLPKDIDNTWNYKCIEDDFGFIVNNVNEVVWKTENYRLSAPVECVTGTLSDENVKLYLQAARPITYEGATLGWFYACMDLSSTYYVDNIKAQTESEITIFAGDERYSTTVINENGRAVGTKMNEDIAKTVLTEGGDYVGTADILGQKHYVSYSPIYGVEGEIVGAYFAGFSSRESDSAFNFVLLLSVGIVVVFLVLMEITIIVMVRKLIREPLEAVGTVADDLARGELKTGDPDYKFTQDEFGQFAEKLIVAKHSLNDCVADISNVLSYMAGGDFSHSHSMDYFGDFSEINESFNAIKERLGNVISEMNRAADDVSNGASQIADGSTMVAEGTTKQATAVDELTSTISDINTKVRESADNAENAAKLSAQSEGKVSEQELEIREMLGAMKEIKVKSDEVSSIVSAIEDIAFQTNILALNASIEAARAGEAGKGFAVVADEVRNLAAKSSESAQNTARLIAETIAAVDNGSEIAESTAAKMTEVKEISSKVDAIIEEIVRAAEEQAQAIGQVSIGIEEISQVIQQNSATSEQTAASCEELSSQAQVLREHISQLKA